MMTAQDTDLELDLKLARLVVEGATPHVAADALGRGVAFVYSRYADPTFKRLLSDMRAAAFIPVAGKLRAELLASVERLAKIRDDDHAAASVRVKACATIFDYAIKLHDMAEVAPRLAEIERQLEERCAVNDLDAQIRESAMNLPENWQERFRERD